MTDSVSRVRAAATERRFRFRVGALVALAVVVALILWLALRDTGGSSSSQSASSSAAIASFAQIRALPASVGHPVFWLGRRKGFRYELTRSPNGSIYIRYLPQGVAVGAPKPY